MNPSNSVDRQAALIAIHDMPKPLEITSQLVHDIPARNPAWTADMSAATMSAPVQLTFGFPPWSVSWLAAH
jgi:hypothetical protein